VKTSKPLESPDTITCTAVAESGTHITFFLSQLHLLDKWNVVTHIKANSCVKNEILDSQSKYNFHTEHNPTAAFANTIQPI